jgi:hypothetical protein
MSNFVVKRDKTEICNRFFLKQSSFKLHLPIITLQTISGGERIQISLRADKA